MEDTTTYSSSDDSPSPNADHDHCQVTIRIPSSVVVHLDEMAKEDFTTRSSIIRRIVCRHVFNWRNTVKAITAT